MADPKSENPQASTPPAQWMDVMRVRHDIGCVFFDFAQKCFDQEGVAIHLVSLVTSPQHAKLVLKALAENLDKYESRFGPIQMPSAPEGRNPK